MENIQMYSPYGFDGNFPTRKSTGKSWAIPQVQTHPKTCCWLGQSPLFPTQNSLMLIKSPSITDKSHQTPLVTISKTIDCIWVNHNNSLS